LLASADADYKIDLLAAYDATANTLNESNTVE
jgi:hypothetical protein